MPKHVQTGTVHMGIYGEGEVATVGMEHRPSAHPHDTDRRTQERAEASGSAAPHTTHAKGAEPLETAPRQRVRYMRSKRCTTSSI